MAPPTDIVPDSERRASIGAFSPLVPLAQAALLLAVLFLAWMKLPVRIGGLESFPMDFAFLASLALWSLALARRETTMRLHWGFVLLGLYLLAMALSLFQSNEPERSAFKLLTQLYLMLLAVLAFNLVKTQQDFRRLFTWWLAGAAGVTLLGLVALLLFPLIGRDSLIAPLIHNFGTLPPGPYPRLELTFGFPSMLLNYLGTALALLLVGERLGWFGRRLTIVGAGAIAVTAFFALTPGFGGFLFIAGLWAWYSSRDSRPLLARVALIVGCTMPIIAVVLASVTPVLHPTAPFLVEIPGLPPLAPSVRLLAWMEAVQNFLQSPIFGNGIGLETVDVDYEASGCSKGCVTDAHNSFLNVAVQTGIIGVAALAAIIWFVLRHIRRQPPRSSAGVILFGLSVAWLSGLAVQGLVGSFEDARHLWIVLGLILSATRLPAEPVKARGRR